MIRYLSSLCICDSVPGHCLSMGYNVGWLKWSYFFFRFVVAIFDLVHDVEAIHDLC